MLSIIPITISALAYPELIIRSSVSIASNLTASVNYLISISRTDIELQNMLVSNDIVEDINIIKNYIQEEQHLQNGKTVQICIENLSSTLEALDANIKSITEKIENHKKLWFNYFRSYDISYEKNKIPLLIRQMKHRFEMLIKISSNLNSQKQ